MTECSEIVEKYRRLVSDIPGRPVSFREFAEHINGHLHNKYTYNGPHWQAIAAGRYRPNYYSAWYLSQYADGWVKDFADEIVMAMEKE